MAEFRLSHAEVAVLSYLLGTPAPQRQVHIAAATGVTQARVSQIMAIADERGWTERCAEGWRVLRPRAVFDHLVTARAPRVTAVSAWYSLDNGPRQIELALERAAAQRVSLHVCGDWAADRIAPWRFRRSSCCTPMRNWTWMRQVSSRSNRIRPMRVWW